MKLALGNYRATIKRSHTMGGFHRTLGHDPKWGYHEGRNFYWKYGKPVWAINLTGGRHVPDGFRRCLVLSIDHRLTESAYRKRMGFKP